MNQEEGNVKAVQGTIRGAAGQKRHHLGWLVTDTPNQQSLLGGPCPRQHKEATSCSPRRAQQTLSPFPPRQIRGSPPTLLPVSPFHQTPSPFPPGQTTGIQLAFSQRDTPCPPRPTAGNQLPFSQRDLQGTPSPFPPRQAKGMPFSQRLVNFPLQERPKAQRPSAQIFKGAFLYPPADFWDDPKNRHSSRFVYVILVQGPC